MAYSTISAPYPATRNSFNRLVQHIQTVLEIFDTCTPKKNIADIITQAAVQSELDPAAIPAILSVLLLDMWKYAVYSVNLSSTLPSYDMLITELQQWHGVDMVFGYHHPDLGFLVLNPKNPAHTVFFETFKKNELLIIYIGRYNKKPLEPDIADSALYAVKHLLEGNKPPIPEQLLKGPFSFVKERTPLSNSKKNTGARRNSKTTKTADQSAVHDEQLIQTAPLTISGGLQISRQISVAVTNELFHNGNVEAWKRIIRSYTARYPKNRVIIFYDGEQITNINTLFKWGKVKHGSSIQFAVIGEQIKELSKLSRYFAEGASPRFEVFLQGSPSAILNLF
ncbi:MAG: hypothetical protein ACTTH7_00880 [Treponema sp.]